MAISNGGSRVNTNIAALNALNALNKVNAELGVHQLRLASGKKINTAADDASGYVISKKMDGRVRALTAASDNVGDAVNVLSVAEGGYGTIADLMTQIKDKVTRFNNAGFGSDEQTALASEIKQLATEIDDVAGQTKFNGKKLLDGTFTAGSTVDAASAVKAGGVFSSNGSDIAVTKLDVSGSAAGTYTFSVVNNKLRLDDGTSHQDIDVPAATSGTVTQGSEYSMNFSNLGVKISVMATGGDIAAADLMAALGGNAITTDAGTSATFQVGEASNETFSVAFQAVSSQGLLGIDAGSISTASIDANFTTNLNNSLSTVLGYSGDIGAQINRLQTKSDMLSTSITNTQAAQSRIQDADIAQEQIQVVKLQILQQTATTQLAQANQSPQVFLSLFR